MGFSYRILVINRGRGRSNIAGPPLVITTSTSAAGPDAIGADIDEHVILP